MAFAMVLYQRKLLTSMGINLLIHDYVYPGVEELVQHQTVKKTKTFYTLSCKAL